MLKKRKTAEIAAQEAQVKTEAAKSDGQPPPRLEFLVVSGLPRSGTSLMMQMLAAGGVSIMTDGKRKPDEDNPEGYYEWEEIKKIRQQPEILRQAEGKAIKVITALLPSLPRRHRYKVIFMDRSIEEIIVSQAKMITRRGVNRPAAEPEHMAQMLAGHRTSMLQNLERARNFDVLKINFSELVSEPSRFVDQIAEFVGRDKVPHPEAMAGVARPELHRNRVTAEV